MVAAYDQLLAQGAGRGAQEPGLFVRDFDNPAADRVAASRRPGWEALTAILPTGAKCALLRCVLRGGAAGVSPVNATALIRGMFHKIGDKPQPGMGVFPSEWLEDLHARRGAQGHQPAQRCRAIFAEYGEPWAMPVCAACWPKSSTLNVRPPEASSPPWAPRMRWTS